MVSKFNSTTKLRKLEKFFEYPTIPMGTGVARYITECTMGESVVQLREVPT
jgi:hypothetical protein